jgi:8-oxo-dGTP diphosphatase
VAPDAVPRVTEAAGTTDAAAWVPLASLDELPVLDVVRVALAAGRV